MAGMKIELPAGKYVVAVSGGVDSVVLLHLLLQKYQSFVFSDQSSDKFKKITPTGESRPATGKSMNYQFIVAHFDHGIRQGSAEDAEFVQDLAQKYQLQFVLGEGRLGPKASEAEARQARYDFLQVVKKDYAAIGIITAHHSDDEIETAIINVLRGTGRRGLAPMRANKNLLRPLLNYSKPQILNYAQQNKLKWREDPSNTDTKYLRNLVRQQIMPKLALNDAKRQMMVSQLAQAHQLSGQIDQILDEIINKITKEEVIYRQLFIALPHNVAAEVLIQWLKQNAVGGLNRSVINKLILQLKTAKVGSQISMSRNRHILVDKITFQLRS